VAAETERGGLTASNPESTPRTADLWVTSVGFVAANLCACKRAIKDAVAPSFSASKLDPVVTGVTSMLATAI
jgi:hypothetical protein